MTDSPETKHPVRLNILALLILAVAAINGVRLGEAIFYWKSLREYGAYPLYISISGGIWLISGVIIAWGILLGRAWARVAVICGTLGYTFWYWFDRLVLQSPHANWRFGLATNLILLVIIFGILFSKRTRRFFKREIYERQSENTTTT